MPRKKLGAYDGIIMGVLLGVVIFDNSIATKFNEWALKLIPTGWDWFGSSTPLIIGVLVGALVGWLVDRSRG